ncbi:MAG: twin-arginine translocase TatA/TatE family subunit [Bdellovibrionales bacterium]
MSLGPMELVLILGIGLLIFGPTRLPGLGRSLGDAIRGFKKGIEGEGEKEAPVHQEQLKPGINAEAAAADPQTQTRKTTTDA